MSVAAFVRRPCPVPPTGPVQVAQLGTSRTHGASPLYLGTDIVLYFYPSGGWRGPMYAKLGTAGANPVFEGTRANSTDGVTDAGQGHDGLNGSSGVNWVAVYFASAAAGMPATPHVVIVEVGTNDTDSSGAATAFAPLADLIAAQWPLARVIWTSPIRALGTDQYVTQTARIRTEMATRIAAGQNLDFADVTTECPIDPRHLPDTQHLDTIADAQIARFLLPYVYRALNL